MLTHLICRIVVIGMSFIWLVACAPVPDLTYVPKIMKISSEVSMDGCVLTAVLEDIPQGECEAGFYYGISGSGMDSRIPAEWNSSKSFSAELTDIRFDAEYSYKAYVRNGQNEIYSNRGYFDSHIDDDPSVVLPYHEVNVGSEYTEVRIEVGGDAQFIVNVSSDAWWITCERDGRLCIFKVEPNISGEIRSGKIVFRNLANNFCQDFTINQFAFPKSFVTIPFNHIELPSGESYFRMSMRRDRNPQIHLHADMCDWITYWMTDDMENTNFTWKIAENRTDEDRIHKVDIEYAGTEHVFTIVQKAWNTIIEFRDPVVRDVCVEAFDLDGDGLLSAYELSQVSNDCIDYLDFSGKEIKSFDEFRFFAPVAWINTPVFSGTGIESIRFPGNMQSIFGGAFMNCTELKDVDLASITVGHEAFKGCTGLKNVTALIYSESVFEDCTGLETVVQQYSGVPDYTFRNCTSLRSFEFSICKISDYCDFIGEEAFRGCLNLPEITITDDIRKFRDRAFYGCSSLKHVFMKSLTPPALGKDVFTGTHPSLEIYVAPESVDAYKAAWPSLSSRIKQ